MEDEKKNYNKPLIGQKIKDVEFEIYQNNKFEKTKLSNYKGKWLVLFFYPADFTFVCPTELGELADSYAEFKKNNIEIISISTDTVFVHKSWHDLSPQIKKIDYPMAADPTGKLSKQFGTYIYEEGLSLRGTFIINPDGVIKAFEVNDNSIGRSTSELLRKVQASIYVENNNGEVCPASWHPGDSILKPEINLVGKI